MKRIALVMLVMLTAFHASVVRSEPVAVVRAAIQAQYNRMDQAFVHNHLEVLDQIFSPAGTLTLVGERRTMPTARFIASMKSMAVTLTVLRSKTRIVSLKPVGGGFEAVAVIDGVSRYAPRTGAQAHVPPKPTPTQQTVRDLWKKTAEGWQITARRIGD